MKLKLDQFTQCLADIGKVAGVEREDAERILQSVADRMEELRKAGAPDPQLTAAKELADAMKAQARKNKLDALNNSRKLGNNIASLLDLGLNGADLGNESAVRLQQKLMGVLGRTRSEAIEDNWLGMARQYLSAIGAELQKEGLDKFANSKDAVIVRDIANALNGQDASPRAKRTAEVMLKNLTMLRDRLNSLGAQLEDPLDFLHFNDFDQDWILGGGRKTAGETRPRIRTVEEAKARLVETMRERVDPSIYEGIVLRSGETIAEARDARLVELANHYTLNVDPPTIKRGPLPSASANIPARLSSRNVVKWRDPGAWVDFTQRYGRQQSIYGMVTSAIFEGERLYSLMDTFGTNPRNGFEKLIKKTYESLADINADAAATFSRRLEGSKVPGAGFQPNLRDAFEDIIGAANRPVKGVVYDVQRVLQGLTTAAYLGNSFNQLTANLFTIFPRAMNLSLGENTFGNIGKSIQALLPRDKSSPEYTEMLGEVGALADAMLRPLYDERTQGALFPGATSTMARWVMKISGDNYMNDRAKQMAREMTAFVFGRDIGKSFAELKTAQRMSLERFDITPVEWDALRATPLKEMNGRGYMSPETALRAQGVNNDDLYRKMGIMWHAIANDATITPGVRERVLFRGRARPGEWGSILPSTLFLFKTWSLTALHRSFGRQMYEATGNKFGGLFFLVAMSAFGGYINLALRSIASGYHPPEPKSWQQGMGLAMQAVGVGGGLGLLADAIAGFTSDEANGGVLSGGPVLDSAAAIQTAMVNWAEASARGRPYDPLPALADVVGKNIPFKNVIYLRAAYNYGFWWHLQEALRPGRWEDSNRRLKQKTGHARYGYQPGRGVPWTPLGVGQ